MLEYYPLSVRIECKVGPCLHPRPASFGLASIGITVDGVTVQHRIEANEANQSTIHMEGDLTEALKGIGTWSYHFDADDEDYFHDGSHRQVTSLDISVGEGEIVIQSDVISRMPLNPSLEASIWKMMHTCELALDHYYGYCMDDMFAD